MPQNVLAEKVSFVAQREPDAMVKYIPTLSYPAIQSGPHQSKAAVIQIGRDNRRLGKR